MGLKTRPTITSKRMSMPAFLNRRAALSISMASMTIAAAMAVLKYYALSTTVMDLGLYQSVMYSFLRLGEWSRMVTGHVHLFMPLYALLAEAGPALGMTLVLCAQAVLVFLPALWLAPRQPVLAVLYCLQPTVWFNALFDFHFDHLTIPLLLGFYVSAGAGLPLRAMVFALLMAGVKEPYALQTVACGLYLVLRAKHVPHALRTWAGKRTADYNPKLWIAAGATAIVGGIAWYVLSTKVVLPHFTPEHNFSLPEGAFDWLGTGPLDVFRTALLHPGAVVSEIVGNPRKLLLIAVLFSGYLFLPILRPLELLPALPPLAFMLLSQSEPHYGYTTHYTAPIAVALLAATACALPTVTRSFERMRIRPSAVAIVTVSAAVLVHVAAAPSPWAARFWTFGNWQYRYSAYVPDDRDKAARRMIERHAPSDPNITVVAQNSLNWGPLMRRHRVLPFPQGTPASPHADACGEIWVFLDESRPLLLLDRGCNKMGDRCEDASFLNQWQLAVNELRLATPIAQSPEGIAVWKTQRNCE